MADNTLQTGNDTMASDDIGGVKYQRTKISWGVDGVATDASAAAPFPVTAINAAGAPLPAYAHTGGAYFDENGNKLTQTRVFTNVASATTDGSLVVAVGGKKVRVLSTFFLAGSAATNLTFNSKGAGAGTAISPLLANVNNSGMVLPHNPLGWFETNTSEALTATTSASGQPLGLHVVYVLV